MHRELSYATIFRVTLCHQLLYQLSSICLWSASELTLYSIEILGDCVTFLYWAHNCRFNHVLYHSQTFSCLQWPTSYEDLSGFKIPFFSCPSGIFCLPHRCHKLSGTRWGDYLVHLKQDENQVKTFLNHKNNIICMPWFQRWSKSKHTIILIH